MGILRIAASLAAAGPGLDWPSPRADVLDPRFAQERFWSVPDLNRVVQDPGPRGKNLGSDEMIWFCQNLIIYLIEISLRSQEVLLFLWPSLLPARNWKA